MARMSRRDFLKVTGTAAAGLGLSAIAGSKESKAAVKTATYSTLLPQVILGNTGVQVSRLGLGGACWFQDIAPDYDPQVVECINEAIDSGVTYLDTANNYDNVDLATGIGTKRSQYRIGQVMAVRRNDVFLATKVEGTDFSGQQRTYDTIMPQVEACLAKLQTDHFDLLQIHMVYDGDNVAAFGNTNGAYWTLQQLKSQGVTNFIGMTGHPYRPGVDGSANVKLALTMYDWDCFLGHVNPMYNTLSALQDQIPAAAAKNMGVIAMKPFGGGYPSSLLVGTTPGYATISDLLRYVLSNPRGQNVHVTIPGLGNYFQMRQLVAVMKTFVAMTPHETGLVEQQINQVTYASDAKRMADAGSVTVNDPTNTGLVVTRVFSDGFYLENADRSAGVKVKGKSSTLGYRVKVAGVMATDTNGERYVNASSGSVTNITTSPLTTLNPTEMPGSAIAGADFAVGASNAGQIGCSGGSGLNTVGLLVKTTGAVMAKGTGYFYLDDGSGVVSGQSYNGVRVDCTGITPPNVGKIVSVVGIATLYLSGGVYYAGLRVKASADIRTFL